jgi:uncharacterized membrane protein
MSDTPPANQPQPAPAATSDPRPLVIVCYFLYLLACINGFTAIIGVVIAHIRRHESAGTIWQSHFDNLILVFWVLVAAVLIAVLAFPLGLWANFSFQFFSHPLIFFLWPPWFLVFPVVFGLIVFPLLVIWYFYRTIRGLIRAAEARPYRD